MIFIREVDRTGIFRRENACLMKRPCGNPYGQSYVPPRCFHTLFIFSARCEGQMRSNSISFVLSVQFLYLSGPVVPYEASWPHGPQLVLATLKSSLGPLSSSESCGGKIVTTLPRGSLGKSQPWSLEQHIASRPTLIEAKRT